MQQCGGEEHDIQCMTSPEITRKQPEINWVKLKERYRHLRDLPLQCEGGEPDILLGVDNGALHRVWGSRYGGKDDPWAEEYPLGWVARGRVTGGMPSVRINFVQTSMLEEEAMRFNDSELFGTEHSGKDALSREDREMSC